MPSVETAEGSNATEHATHRVGGSHWSPRPFSFISRLLLRVSPPSPPSSFVSVTEHNGLSSYKLCLSLSLYTPLEARRRQAKEEDLELIATTVQPELEARPGSTCRTPCMRNLSCAYVVGTLRGADLDVVLVADAGLFERRRERVLSFR